MDFSPLKVFSILVFTTFTNFWLYRPAREKNRNALLWMGFGLFCVPVVMLPVVFIGIVALGNQPGFRDEDGKLTQEFTSQLLCAAFAAAILWLFVLSRFLKRLSIKPRE